MSCPQKCYSFLHKNITCLIVCLLRTGHYFVSCKTVYLWFMENCCFMSNICLEGWRNSHKKTFKQDRWCVHLKTRGITNVSQHGLSFQPTCLYLAHGKTEHQMICPPLTLKRLTFDKSLVIYLRICFCGILTKYYLITTNTNIY